MSLGSIQYSIGFLGYFAGPKIHIIDRYALADPLLARLPSRRDYVDGTRWRIGHFIRDIPEGYPDYAIVGAPTIADPALARYCDELFRITRGPLWTRERWTAILRLNLGLSRPPAATAPSKAG